MKISKMLQLVNFNINDAPIPVIGYVKNLDGDVISRTSVLDDDDIELSDELILEDSYEKCEVVKFDIDTTLCEDNVTLLMLTFYIDTE